MIFTYECTRGCRGCEYDMISTLLSSFTQPFCLSHSLCVYTLPFPPSLSASPSPSPPSSSPSPPSSLPPLPPTPCMLCTGWFSWNTAKTRRQSQILDRQTLLRLWRQRDHLRGLCQHRQHHVSPWSHLYRWRSDFRDGRWERSGLSSDRFETCFSVSGIRNRNKQAWTTRYQCKA